ncbi:MAG TPA: cyclic nucleotide-binding domain-containing protein [Caldithrix abyssi]|uniref:Cyclic nucleotide-binding domain-containing protein n=1 Tax=Caldithrix abyssi TaxID=187145 RepID=A0A7V4UC83_CALAY|nr:cyclic nucleotide-binding domain-containing protein [Caldithrix abyssi]
MQEDTVWSNIFKKKEVKQEGIFHVLKRVPIFRNLNNRELRMIERILHKRTYVKDEIIFNEGEPGVGMYIIESGRVHITLGKEKKLLAVLSDGDFFGEMALLLETPRTATAVAQTPLRMLGFFQPDLFNLLETHPRIGNKVILHLAQMIAERLRHTSLENSELKKKLNQLEEQLAAKKV